VKINVIVVYNYAVVKVDVKTHHSGSCRNSVGYKYNTTDRSHCELPCNSM